MRAVLAALALVLGLLVTPAMAADPPNLAAGKAASASSFTDVYRAANVTDGNQATYWESANNALPQWVQVDLGSVAAVDRLVLKLPSGWPSRTQTLTVQGSADGSSFATLVASATYTFNPETTITLSGSARFLRLQINANTGWPAGQLSEFEVYGTAGPNPGTNLALGKAMTESSHNQTYVAANADDGNVQTYWEGGAYPNTLTVQLGGNADLTSIVLKLNPDPIWARRTQTIQVLGREESTSSFTGLVAATTYTFDPASGNTVTIPVTARVADVQLRITANSGAPGGQVAEFEVYGKAVPPPQTADIVPVTSWTPGNPAQGDTVTFSVAIRNQGTVATSGGSHGITLTLTDSSGNVVKTATGSVSGALAPGATSAAVGLGTWTAANGNYTVRTVLADDPAELPAQRANNTATQPLFVGRGAHLPYDMYEAEDATIGGGATRVGPNRTIGDLGGEASGRRAVTLGTTGAYVEFTTRASTNTLVTRFSVPDGNDSTSLNIYVDGTFLKPINLTSRYAWLYGPEASPNNSPGSGPARHIYDEASVLLGTTVPKGSRIRLQKDPANGATYTIDFVNLEQATAAANPDPSRYAVPAGFSQQDVQNALDRARQDSSLVGVYLPTGDYQLSSKLQVYGKAVKIVGAGPWYTRFLAPSGQENTDVGFRTESSANGSTYSGFAVFGNYTSRIDGPGKVFDFSNVANMVIDDVWIEHFVCMFWGTNTDNTTIRNSRIRDTFADGINMTNGSTGNLVTNVEARSTGDDSFALFSAIDNNPGEQHDNVFENLTSLLTWRAAGVAVYGGYGNTFRNIYVADTLVYSGVTISSLDFGIPMNGFGASPPTTFDGITLVRDGGHFWGQQTFPAMWLFSASKVFQGIRVNNLDIVDPTYHGIMFQTNYVGGQPQNPVKDTVLTNVSISGAQRSGDAFDAKSGFAIWANELPEPDQGPAVGSATFNTLRLSNNATGIRNTTSTFTVTVNP